MTDSSTVAKVRNAVLPLFDGDMSLVVVILGGRVVGVVVGVNAFPSVGNSECSCGFAARQWQLGRGGTPRRGGADSAERHAAIAEKPWRIVAAWISWMSDFLLSVQKGWGGGSQNEVRDSVIFQYSCHKKGQLLSIK